MKKLLASLIVWLMLVAVPFQGFAAASMPPCAPVPHHHHATMHAAPAGDTSAHHHAGGKCNHCASCCFGAAIAPAAIRVAADAPQQVAFHFTPGHVARVDLALPERPPQAVPM